jgi:hypothetical protein
MKINFTALTLQCKQSREVIEFSPRLSVFYGKMSSGKSSIARLVDFCLGGDLERTPALDRELVSVHLSARIGRYEVLFEREAFGSSQVQVTWRDEAGLTGSVLAPLTATATPIWEDQVYNLSDLVFYLLEMTPIKVPKSTRETESEMVRLSFRDIMWYCYLEQENLDSSFFWLKTPFKDRKSRYVLSFVVGAYNEKLNQLEIELSRIRESKRRRNEEVQQLRSFLRQFGYSSESQILEEIQTTRETLQRASSELDRIQEGYAKDTHFADDLREQLRFLEKEVSTQERALTELQNRIAEQESLKAELIGAKFKLARTRSAKNILEGVTFEFCPSCGLKLTHTTEEKHTCSLCGQHRSEKVDLAVPTNDAVQIDLDARIEELGESIGRHNTAQVEQTRVLSELKSKKSLLDSRLDEELKRYDSKFLSQSREIERQIAALGEKIRSLGRAVEMPKAVTTLEKEMETFSANEERVKRETAEEKEKLVTPEKLIGEIEKNYLEVLLAIELPGLSENDKIQINRTTWIPYVLPSGNEEGKWDFFNAGSAGKKTLLNVSFALAVHKVAAEKNLPLPNFLIIDSPMKNIGKGVNREIFESFYRYLYSLAQGPLSKTQFILIDTDYFPPTEKIDMLVRFMTPDDEKYPPLIPYYRGP